MIETNQQCTAEIPIKEITYKADEIKKHAKAYLETVAAFLTPATVALTNHAGLFSTNYSQKLALSVTEFITGWVAYMQSFLTRSNKINHDSAHDAARSFVGGALNALRKNQWNNLPQKHANYSIPESLITNLISYTNDHSDLIVLLQKSPDLTKIYETLLNRNEINKLYSIEHQLRQMPTTNPI